MLSSGWQMESKQQNPQQVRTTKDAVVDALPQTSPESSGMPLNPIDNRDTPTEDSTPLEAIVEALEEAHSTSLQDDERNREYLIRRTALGGNPTQEQMMQLLLMD